MRPRAGRLATDRFVVRLAVRGDALRVALVVRAVVVRAVEALRAVEDLRGATFLVVRFRADEALAGPARRFAADFADFLDDRLGADFLAVAPLRLPALDAGFRRLVEAAFAAASLTFPVDFLGLLFDLAFVAFVRPVAIVTSFAPQQVGRRFQPTHRA